MGDYEDKFTGGDNSQADGCGTCWCCRRQKASTKVLNTEAVQSPKQLETEASEADLVVAQPQDKAGNKDKDKKAETKKKDKEADTDKKDKKADTKKDTQHKPDTEEFSEEEQRRKLAELEELQVKALDGTPDTKLRKRIKYLKKTYEGWI